MPGRKRPLPPRWHYPSRAHIEVLGLLPRFSRARLVFLRVVLTALLGRALVYICAHFLCLSGYLFNQFSPVLSFPAGKQYGWLLIARIRFLTPCPHT